ncbi:protoporphyrinogen oxidase [Agrococcus sp. SGAir0287]|uniref:protoporphyrinogen oxidase n=1 Tax=Agrococcus sp. SGAir0287 TaxID=2070347 RepID=UPI0010CD08CC|nr:protoporphyrinogen oxidase [Agrococcus sp. SGAir0287]QCR18114.1 protoporphyrinogen oxidase [Agrococcus sp. SGAir0287]
MTDDVAGDAVEVEQAQPADQPQHEVVVIGAGVAGLVAAHDLSRRGYDVVVLEARDRVGGIVARHDLAGLALDAGAESFAMRGGAVAELAEQLGLGDDLVDPEPGGAWLRLQGRSVPLPRRTMLGIPSVPLAEDVIAVLGWRGALRAYLDRLMPVLKVGKDERLGPLVERRMGKAVLERLVAPISGGVYSSNARDLDVAVVAPGLNEAMTRAGSLSGGVALRIGDGARPGSAVRGIRGGMHRLPEALRGEVERRATIVTGVAVDRVERTATGWAAQAGERRWTASALVVATPGEPAALLLAGAGIAVEAAPATTVELVTLVLPALEGAPEGSGALVAEDAGIAAKALTHATAKWAWLAEQADGRSVLRVSYGRAGEAPATAALSDDEAIALARRDASAILGVDVPEPIAADRVRWEQAQPSSSVGARAMQQRVRAAIEDDPTLEVVGAWIAGTGLAQVVPDARAAALRIRRERFASQEPDGEEADGEEADPEA